MKRRQATQVLSVTGAARFLKVSNAGVRLFERRGELTPCAITENGYRAYLRQDVEDLGKKRAASGRRQLNRSEVEESDGGKE